LLVQYEVDDLVPLELHDVAGGLVADLDRSHSRDQVLDRLRIDRDDAIDLREGRIACVRVVQQELGRQREVGGPVGVTEAVGVRYAGLVPRVCG
jgi:hypothetical protein